MDVTAADMLYLAVAASLIPVEQPFLLDLAARCGYSLMQFQRSIFAYMEIVRSPLTHLVSLVDRGDQAPGHQPGHVAAAQCVGCRYN